MSTSEQEFTFSDWYLSLALFFQMQDIINTHLLNIPILHPAHREIGPE